MATYGWLIETFAVHVTNNNGYWHENYFKILTLTNQIFQRHGDSKFKMLFDSQLTILLSRIRVELPHKITFFIIRLEAYIIPDVFTIMIH